MYRVYIAKGVVSTPCLKSAWDRMSASSRNRKVFEFGWFEHFYWVSTRLSECRRFYFDLKDRSARASRNFDALELRLLNEFQRLCFEVAVVSSAEMIDESTALILSNEYLCFCF